MIETLTDVADFDSTLAVHDVSHGGLAVTLAEMVHTGAGASVELDADADPTGTLFSELPGRAVVETTDPDAVRTAFEEDLPVTRLGDAIDSPVLDVDVGGERLVYDGAEIGELRSTIERALD